MTDRGVYLLLGLLILALAGAEVVYAMVGPFSEPTQQDDQFGTINPVRGKIVQCSRVDHEFQSSSRPAHSDVAAIGPFDQGSPLCNQISHRPPFGRLSEKVDIQSDSPLCKRAHHHSTRRPWFEISRYID
jgi:hypothetical protein